MSHDPSIPRLRQQTVEAAEARRREQTQRDKTGSSPIVGDLYVLPATRDWPVEWAVTRVDDHLAQAWVVPADTHPLLGEGDMAVEPEDGGPFQLRCRFGAWVPVSDLLSTNRSGGLAATVATEADAARGQDGACILEQAQSLDPSYEDWVTEVLIPARAALRAKASDTQR